MYKKARYTCRVVVCYLNLLLFDVAVAIAVVVS